MGKKRRSKGAETLPSRTHLRSVGWLVVFVLVASAALALYRFAAQEAPDVPDADRSLMEPQVAAKIQVHRQAVLADPDSGEAWSNLGVVFQAHGLTEEASRCYRRALELDPRDFRSQYLLVHTLRGLDREAALAESARALELAPDYAPIYVVRGEMVEDKNELQEAKALYRKGLELDPESALALFGLGRIAMGEDDVEAARLHLERARELSPQAGSVHAQLARLYRRIGESDKAADEAQQASLAKEPIGVQDPIHFRMTQESVASTAELKRARAAEEAGDYAGAERIYRELVALRPEDADLRAGLGDSLARQDRSQEAKQHYRTALELQPDHAAALYGLATIVTHEGNYDEAVSLYRKSLAVRPDHAPSLNNLASVLAFQGKPDEALALYEKALGVDPENVASHRGLGEWYFREKKYEEAARHYRKVLEAKPDLGAVHLQLGRSLAMSRSYRDARSHLTRARELGETVPDEILAEVERRLAPGPR